MYHIRHESLMLFFTVSQMFFFFTQNCNGSKFCLFNQKYKMDTLIFYVVLTYFMFKKNSFFHRYFHELMGLEVEGEKIDLHPLEW